MGQQIQLQFSSNILEHNSYGLNSFEVAKTFSISSSTLGSYDAYSHYFYFLLERWKQKNNLYFFVSFQMRALYT